MAKGKQPIKNQPATVKATPMGKPAAKAPAPSQGKGITEKTLIYILVAVAVVVNIRTLSYEYVYDDAAYASKNTLIDIKGGIKAIPELFTHAKNYNFQKLNYGSYRPLLPITFAIERQFAGDFSPFVSHTVNMLMFVALIFVLFKLLRRMFSSYSAYIPFFILLLYELHPVHTEVVANVKSRDELMALLFTAMSMIETFKYLDDAKPKRLALCAVYFFLAMLSKESPICFLAIVPMTLYFFTNAKVKQMVMTDIPYFFSAVLFLVLRYAFLDKVSPRVGVTENTLVAAKNFGERFATVLMQQLMYLRMLVFPHPLSYDYSYNQVPIVQMSNISSMISLVIFAGLLGYAIVRFKQKDVYSWCILFYCITMSVTANLLIETGATMGERFLFVPSLAFCIALIFLLARIMKINIVTVNFKTTTFAYTIFAIAAVYSIKTMARNEDWKSNYTLYKSGIETAPNSWRAQKALGLEYQRMANEETNAQQKAKYLTEAIPYFEKSISIYPTWGETHAALGAAFFALNNFDSAMIHLQRAVVLDPHLEPPLVNLGSIYLNRQNWAEALKWYLKAREVNPNNIIAVFNSGVCYYQLQKPDSAIACFKKGITVDPSFNDHKAFEYTAIIYKTLGQMDSSNKYAIMGQQYK
jgi:protein O-mannosyl-transferase